MLTQDSNSGQATRRNMLAAVITAPFAIIAAPALAKTEPLGGLAAEDDEWPIKRFYERCWHVGSAGPELFAPDSD